MANRSQYPADRRSNSFRARRLALTAVAAGLMVAALATLSDAGPHPHHAPHPRKAAAHRASWARGGEPQLSRNSTGPRAPRTAAVRFVRDYAAWEAGRLSMLPSYDATERVIRLLEHAGRYRLRATRDLRRSVRVTAFGEHRYLATSAVGNFLIGRRRSQWLVVSLPGD